MSISVSWGDDTKRYILVVYEGEWTWDDYKNSYLTRYEMIRSVDHRVDVVIDVRKHPAPPDPFAAQYIKWAWDTRPPNLGRMIHIGANANTFMSNLIRIFGNQVDGTSSLMFVDTLEEALEVINAPS